MFRQHMERDIHPLFYDEFVICLYSSIGPPLLHWHLQSKKPRMTLSSHDSLLALSTVALSPRSSELTLSDVVFATIACRVDAFLCSNNTHGQVRKQ
jgi:hypothetical protein